MKALENQEHELGLPQAFAHDGDYLCILPAHMLMQVPDVPEALASSWLVCIYSIFYSDTKFLNF